MTNETESVIGPKGVVVAIGQRWRENDPRIDRVVEVVGFSNRNGLIRVLIQAITSRKPTNAALERFNGNRGCYKLEVEK